MFLGTLGGTLCGIAETRCVGGQRTTRTHLRTLAVPLGLCLAGPDGLSWSLAWFCLAPERDIHQSVHVVGRRGSLGTPPSSAIGFSPSGEKLRTRKKVKDSKKTLRTQKKSLRTRKKSLRTQKKPIRTIKKPLRTIKKS